MTAIQLYWLIAVSLTLMGNAAVAQTADTETFLAANFRLQETYSNVLCVAQDDPCPAEITTTVPCLSVDCPHEAASYPVSGEFESIQAAVDSAQPGDLVIIMPGRYRGVQVEETGGEDGAYIHLLGWGEPGSVIVDSAADPEVDYLRHHFYFVDTHHYMIQNIAFENADEGAGLFFTGYFSGTGHFSHHIIVMDVYSHDNGKWGLHTTSTSYMVIQDSIFTGSVEEHGAYISGSGDYMLIRRNVFQGNSASGLQVNADPQTAISELFYWLANSTGDTCDLSEEDVEFTGSATWEDMKACYDAQGLPDLGEYIEDGISENLIIEQNIMTGNGDLGGAGINLASVRHSTVRSNLIYGNFAAGIACWDNAYAEEKGLASSDFGCQNVSILNNTLVDETGGRGALILNQDARDMVVKNNIIVRDRFDAYEIAGRSGEGLVSGHNYYSALSVEDASGWQQIDTDADSGSVTGFSVADALSNFVAPGFASWVLEDGAWPTLNPDRPDYHLVSDSPLLGMGEGGTMIGALGEG